MDGMLETFQFPNRVQATWRNGSAFGFDCRRYQKVAGSSPAVVMFLSIQGRNINVFPLLCLSFWVELERVDVYHLWNVVI